MSQPRFPAHTNYAGAWYQQCLEAALAQFPPVTRQDKSPAEYREACARQAQRQESLVDSAINWKLARAIGWDGEEDARVVGRTHGSLPHCDVWFDGAWRIFDYKDPTVLLPIQMASGVSTLRYLSGPRAGWVRANCSDSIVLARSEALAVVLAVIAHAE